jgi:predicted ribosomally synthesized peptide with SipW-like signal peptide
VSAIKKKLIVTMLATIAIVASFIFGTVAYFTETVSSDHNIIIMTGDAKAEVSDVVLEHGTNIPLPSDRELDVIPGYKYAKNVTVENTGNYPLYVRGKIDCRIELSELNAGREDEIDYSLVIADIDTENWIFSDGYYYYKKPLYEDEMTTSLVSSIHFSDEMDNFYKSSTIYFKVRIEIVQSNNNGESVLEATGWPSSEGGEP